MKIRKFPIFHARILIWILEKLEKFQLLQFFVLCSVQVLENSIFLVHSYEGINVCDFFVAFNNHKSFFCMILGIIARFLSLLWRNILKRLFKKRFILILLIKQTLTKLYRQLFLPIFSRKLKFYKLSYLFPLIKSTQIPQLLSLTSKILDSIQ